MEGSKGSGKSAAVKYEHGSWSPDGADIVFNENENRLIKRSIDGSFTTLYSRYLDGNNARLIRQSDRHPGGHWIAFGVSEDHIIDGSNVGDFDVRVVDANGVEVTNLTSQFDQAAPVNAVEFEPTWSPSGTRLAFVRWLYQLGNETKQIHICDFVDGLNPALECTTDEDGVPVSPWREAVEIFSPTWHRSAETPVIAYLESAAVVGGNPTRADLFIESPDDATCIHIKADNSPYPGTRPGCTVHEIGTFRFSVDLAWSCDGQGLLVSGIDPNTNDHGTYLISDVFAAVVAPPAALILPSGGEQHATQAKSRVGCP
jgi:hypothetical protein